MTGPAYDLLVVLHVLSAVVGFGAVGVTGAYAAGARSTPEPRRDVRLRRYFSPGRNWAERSLLLTPVLGAIVLVSGDRGAAAQPWPWIGLACWAAAAAIATAWNWPAEHRVQTWLAGGAALEGPAGSPGTASVPGAGDLESFREDCRRLEWGATAISLLFLAAVVVMVAQPS
jgi:hypothetical protein